MNENYQKLLDERNDLAEQVKRLQQHIKEHDMGEVVLSVEEILAVEDKTKRQRLISENLHLFMNQ